MRVEIIPCLTDNYAYLLVDESRNLAAVVDASEPEPVIAAIERAGVPLVAVLSTHHHHDHVGGNETLIETYPHAAVYGHRHDLRRTPALSQLLDHDARFMLGTFSVHALHVPGHTLGALTYVVRQGDGPAWAFTGDTLFLAGCGRLFEGTPAQMRTSLVDVLGALPDDTLIACGHEYTASNLRFAAHVEPHNREIAARAEQVAKARERGIPTVPSPLALERATNPFLRLDAPAVRAHVGLDASAPATDVFAALRREKDGFR